MQWCMVQRMNTCNDARFINKYPSKPVVQAKYASKSANKNSQVS